MGKEHAQTVLKRRYTCPQETHEKCSISLVKIEIQIETTMSNHLNTIQMLSLKRQKVQM